MHVDDVDNLKRTSCTRPFQWSLFSTLWSSSTHHLIWLY